MKKIKNVVPNEMDLDLIARVEKVNVLSGTTGQSYMVLHLADNSGRLEARKWVVNEIDKEKIQPNKYLILNKATTSEYRGQLQVKINDYQIIEADELKDYGLQTDDFFISAPVNVEKEYKKLMTILNDLENKTYQKITIGLIKKHQDKFLTYPAAMTIHHNVTGGLFWHSYTLVRNALAIKDNYKYAKIDWELLICGSILHDIGKVVEIIDVTGVDYSLEGKMLGHISIGNSEIAKIAEDLKIIDQKHPTNKYVTLLEHMVLASHGKNEFGSPVEPMIIEAIILSTFDNLDARIYRTNDEINKVNVDQWTPRILSENGKMFLNHFDKNQKHEK